MKETTRGLQVRLVTLSAPSPSSQWCGRAVFAPDDRPARTTGALRPGGPPDPGRQGAEVDPLREVDETDPGHS